ncbi:hypothetical protein B0H17DRAFT_1130451 [Mycena rosella]|uniref:Uncharacterized protein n=1 Tax=Mycena rosella TaxID=1033263 RepID=A0AAD7GIW7_MYCRO|nr:hypothetical protein B0H17DRAFT_1130451 [Mycena rosella]
MSVEYSHRFATKWRRMERYRRAVEAMGECASTGPAVVQEEQGKVRLGGHGVGGEERGTEGRSGADGAVRSEREGRAWRVAPGNSGGIKVKFESNRAAASCTDFAKMQCTEGLPASRHEHNKWTVIAGSLHSGKSKWTQRHGAKLQTPQGEGQLLGISVVDEPSTRWKIKTLELHSRPVAEKAKCLKKIRNFWEVEAKVAHDKVKFGPVALNKQLVLKTWSGLLLDEASLPDDWTHEGVLVGGYRDLAFGTKAMISYPNGFVFRRHPKIAKTA